MNKLRKIWIHKHIEGSSPPNFYYNYIGPCIIKPTTRFGSTDYYISFPYKINIKVNNRVQSSDILGYYNGLELDYLISEGCIEVLD